ncbi:MAG: serine hydrolase [Gemmatimonadales bacterium]|nr:serine hydrolase [Gemmatimonadales bacterium]
MRLASLAAVCAVAVVVAPLPAQRAATHARELAAIDNVVTSMMKEWQVPGLALGIVKDGKVLYLKGYGYRDLEQQLPVTPQTRMAIGSNSKSFTALLMGMLVDQGKLDWDKPVKQYLPDFEMYDDYATRNLTPRDLVSHSSGLPRHDMVWYGRDVRRHDLLGRLKYLEPTTSLRGKWQYQNLMFVTAGILVERLWGRSWEDLIRGEIFGPLGMTQSLPGTTGIDGPGDFSWPYQLVNDKITRIPYRVIDEVGPAGSITSTVEDMVKYIQFRLDRGAGSHRVKISAAQENLMQSPQMVVGAAAGAVWPGVEMVSYGLGLGVGSYRGHGIVIHGGGIDGFISQMSWIPSKNIGVVVLTNSGNPIPTLVVESVYDRLLGLPPVDYAAIQRKVDAEGKAQVAKAQAEHRASQKQGTSPSHPLAAYAGTYQHPGYGRLVIREAGGRLALGLDKLEAPLRHFHYDVFEVDPTIGTSSLSGMASFGLNLKGEVEQVALPLEPGVKPIVFTRVKN